MAAVLRSAAASAPSAADVAGEVRLAAMLGGAAFAVGAGAWAYGVYVDMSACKSSPLGRATKAVGGAVRWINNERRKASDKLVTVVASHPDQWTFENLQRLWNR